MVTAESEKLRQIVRNGLHCRCGSSGNGDHSSNCEWNNVVEEIYRLERLDDDKNKGK